MVSITPEGKEAKQVSVHALRDRGLEVSTKGCTILHDSIQSCDVCHMIIADVFYQIYTYHYIDVNI